jgi:glycosyltransferase involved in cell wall biosynthesis
MILSICIPTYNRDKFLKVCLENLLPQATKYKEVVEIIVIDNDSKDNTYSVVNNFIKHYPFLKYHRNIKNIGYTGNQIKAYTLPMGIYTAFLSDDDVYLNTLLDKLLNILYLKKYDFVALNYYGFKDNFNVVYSSNFAPQNNVEFERGYDILNYNSVGHWSGFIIITELAKTTLNTVLKLKSLEEFEKNRGIISEMIHRALSKTNKPSFFFGERLLAVNIPKSVDYDVFHHLYIDDYKFYLQLYYEHIINESDLLYRRQLILSKLKTSIITRLFQYNNLEVKNIIYELDNLFKDDSFYYKKIRPYFFIINFYPIKQIIKFIYFIFKKFNN